MSGKPSAEILVLKDWCDNAIIIRPLNHESNLLRVSTTRPQPPFYELNADIILTVDQAKMVRDALTKFIKEKKAKRRWWWR